MYIFKCLLTVFITSAYLLQAAESVDYLFSLSSPSPVLTPVSITIHTDGTLFVADSGEQKIKVFTSTGTLITEFDGTNGGDAFQNLQQIAVSASKEVYVPDIDLNKVQVFDEFGVWQREFDGTGGIMFNQPKAIAIDDSGDIYVGSSNLIQKFTPAGVFISAFAVLQTPEYLTYHIEGGTPFIYVTTSVLGDTLQKYTLTGVLEESVDPWSDPCFELVATNNLIYVCDDVSFIDEYSPLNLNTGSFFGGSSGGGVSFIKTTSIAVDPSGDLYVGDTSLHNIQKYDTNGLYQGITIQQNRLLESPLLLDVSSSGNIYVPDLSSNIVNVFSPDGNFLSSFTGPPSLPLSDPLAISFNDSGIAFVTDQDRNIVNVFEEDGTPLYSIDGLSLGQPQFADPFGITINKDGNLIIVDQIFNLVKFYSTEGIFLGFVNGTFTNPIDVAVNSKGEIFVTDAGLVRVFDSDGNPLTTFDGTDNGGELFSQPVGITIDNDDQVYVVDNTNANVQVFNADGLFQFVINGDEGDGEKFLSPFGVALNSSGNILVSDITLNNVQVYRIAATLNANVSGACKKNVFLTQTNYFNEISFALQSGGSFTPTGYKIYRGATLIATLPAQTSFTYLDNSLINNFIYNYTIVAEGPSNESVTFQVQIQCK